MTDKKTCNSAVMKLLLFFLLPALTVRFRDVFVSASFLRLSRLIWKQLFPCYMLWCNHMTSWSICVMIVTDYKRNRIFVQGSSKSLKLVFFFLFFSLISFSFRLPSYSINWMGSCSLFDQTARQRTPVVEPRFHVSLKMPLVWKSKQLRKQNLSCT